MNRHEKDIIRKLIDSTAGVYRPTSLDAQIQAWTDLRGALTAAVALVEQPDTDNPGAEVTFTTEYELECWYPDGQEWGGGCGWQAEDPEDALNMLEWCGDYRRRVVRYDRVTTAIVLGERDAEPGDA